MAVDQARHINMNLFKEILPSSNKFNNNVVNNNNDPFLSNMNNDLSFQPLYNLNDVVFHPGKVVLPPQPAVKDDSGITFNNNNNNSSLIVQQQQQQQQQQQVSRKRSREVISCVAPQSFIMNPVSTTSRSTTTSSINKDVTSFSFLGDDLSLQIMQQHLELDRLISNHMEKVRLEMEERKRQQMRRIIAVVEEELGRRLRDKDEELGKILKINWALEDKVKSLCLENQIWRDLAQTNEATANALRTNLDQVLQQMNENAERAAVAAAEVADDAVSCCGSSGYGGDVEEREKEGEWLMKRSKISGEENGKNGWVYRGKPSSIETGNRCRKCGEGESAVLILPCRHLCLCTTCGPAVNSCPICNEVKTASVHVNLSGM